MRGFAWLVALSLNFCAAWCAQAGTPPEAVLPDEPLASLASRADPVMVLDLALKSANAGAAYRDNFDRTKIYAGYWDPLGCYGYAVADGYFKREARAARGSGGEISCRQKWSGNLLNWAAASALDGVRMALTGGDRVVDEAGRTVLQRAMLPDDFYRSARFPDKAVTGNLDQLTPLVAGGAEGVRAADTLHFNNCRGGIFIGPTANGTCAKPGSDQRFGPGIAAPYQARVEVCTPDEALTRGAFCPQYPSGKRKPVGAIQRQAQRMRFAVFGYLPGDDAPRYGGVLRAPMQPMQPVGPPDEWDPVTGVFKPAPAGVVAAVNRFGRSGSYSKFDPAGELYYESLRYLQGKPPTPQALAGAGASNDGLPVHGGPAAAPSCQRRSILLIGDADTDHDRSLPGMSRNGSPADFDRAFNEAAFEPDTARWTSLVGAFENREALPYAHPSGKPGLDTRGNEGPRAFNYKGGAQLGAGNIAEADTGADKGSFGVAGLAYWANTQKIRGDFPGARVQTFAIDMGPGAIGQPQRGSAFYLASKYGGFVDSNDDGNPFRSTGRAGNAEWAEGLDADGLPSPSTYFLAGEPGPMAAAVRRALLKAAAPSDFGGAGSAISSDQIGGAGAHLYVARSNGWRWSGTLLSYALAHDAGSGTVRRGDRPEWDAGTLLTGNATAKPPVPAREPSSRRIFSLSEAGIGVPFLWEALDDAARKQLGATPYAEPATSDASGPERVAYLRGDRRKEQSAPGGIFRVRDSVMGDVANSVPVTGPRQAVYVGANDGMLHAFSAQTGEELFAYVPRTLLPGLGAYTSPDYAHRGFADGPPAVGEVRAANGARKAVLVSGNGGGATGVFALDVTDPAAFAADKVMWEFSGADDRDMGHLTQPPRLMKFRTAAASRGRPAEHGWFAVVPSGFNSANPEGRAALFLLSLDKAPGVPWARGVNYHKVVLPIPADKTVVNALGVPGDFAGTEGAVRFLYAGDTLGNLWRFSFTGDAPWDEGNALSFEGHPLMVAVGAGGGAKRQPITVAPVVGRGPDGGAIVLFGTGKFMSPEDFARASHGLQSVYAVHDNGTPIPMGAARAQLEVRSAVAAAGEGLAAITGKAFAYGQPHGRRGWYFDLPASSSQGERLVFNPVLSDGQLFFNTLIPSTGAGACDGGGGRNCAVNALTGLSKDGTCVPSDTGIWGPPLLAQLGEVGVGAVDMFGRRTETRRMAVINVGAGGGRSEISTSSPVADGKVSRIAGRLNWRQVIDHKGAKP
jgi:type IV pilus assembly protein PilY1